MPIDPNLYVGFSRGKGFFNGLLARVVLAFTGGRADHSLLYYQDEHLGWMTIGANDNGVTYMAMDQFLRSRTIVAAFKPADPGTTLWLGLRILRGKIDAGYDYSGLLGMAPVEIARKWFRIRNAKNFFADPRTRLFCSEFTVDVIRSANLPVLLSQDSDTIDPADEMAALEKSLQWRRVAPPQ